ncbi:DUF721 domain-containing protein [Corynebacterium urealyticum]|uniref:DUF721 domain-containing protein n=1 Tax=Corynebacterium urealyticum TaxID=43771 RepID=UPI0021CC556E|nr:DciA family protein [Corynebacterium urealyticum]
MTEHQPREQQSRENSNREEQFLDPVAQALEAIKKAGGKPATGKNADLPRMARRNGWNRGRRGTLVEPATDSGSTGRSARTSSGVKRIKTRMDGRADRSYRDPGSFSALLSREIRRQGWEENVGVRRLMQDWEHLVGPKIAAHTRPVKFDEKNKFLHVQSDSTPWATQLRLIQATILSKIAQELGPDVVVELKIHNPDYGPRQTGRLRVQGRGKRDDYG